MSCRASDRVTGFALALAFVMPTIWTWFGRGKLWLWTMPVAALLALTATIAPRRLHPLCASFHWLSGTFHRTLGKLALVIIFFVFITPLGLLIRATGHDPMARRKKDRESTYWKAVEPRLSGEDAFLDQF